MCCFFRFRWWPFSLGGKETLILRAYGRRVSHEGLMTCHREGQKVPPHNPSVKFLQQKMLSRSRYWTLGQQVLDPTTTMRFFLPCEYQGGMSRVPSWNPSNKTLSASIAAYTLLDGRLPKLGDCLREHSKEGP